MTQTHIKLSPGEFTRLAAGVIEGGDALRFRAHGSSMTPAIQDGDLLTVEPLSADRLRIGDIALYRTALDTLIAHRVCLRFPRSSHPLRAAGDADPKCLERVADTDILGRAIQLERDGKVFRLNTRLPAIGAATRIILVLSLKRVARLPSSLLRR